MSHCDKLSLVILFIYHPSLQVRAANTHSREESSGYQSFTVSLFTNTHSDREQRQGEGRAANTGISGGHLHTCECLNRSALDTGGAQRTIQLCKHAATSFPQLLQACTETSHCLNSTHSIPVPGPRPAAASSMQACLAAWAETDTGLTTARVIRSRQRAFIDMQNWTHLLEMLQSPALAT